MVGVRQNCVHCFKVSRNCISDSKIAPAASYVAQLIDSLAVSMCRHRPLESTYIPVSLGCRVVTCPNLTRCLLHLRQYIRDATTEQHICYPPVSTEAMLNTTHASPVSLILQCKELSTATHLSPLDSTKNPKQLGKATHLLLSDCTKNPKQFTEATHLSPFDCTKHPKERELICHCLIAPQPNQCQNTPPANLF